MIDLNTAPVDPSTFSTAITPAPLRLIERQLAEIGKPRQDPWASVGQPCAGANNSQEALARAGLNWTVARQALQLPDGKPAAGYEALVRSDNAQVLGVVGRGYELFQNAEMAALLDGIAGAGRISFERAGCFLDGRIVFIQARLPDHDLSIGDDQVIPYLLASSGHDGHRPITICPTTVRVVCQNTLAMALDQQCEQRRKAPGLLSGWDIRHSRNMREALAEVEQAYAGTLQAIAKTRDCYQRLASIPINQQFVNRYLQRVFPARQLESGPQADASEALVSAGDRRKLVETILAGPTGQVRGTKDSAFALLNAVTEYADHLRPTRAQDGEPDASSRLRSATWGSGAQFKRRAWDVMLELAN